MMNHIHYKHQNHNDGSDDSVVSCDGRDGSIVYDTDCSCGHIMEDEEEIVEQDEEDIEAEMQEINDEDSDDDRAIQVVMQIIVEIVLEVENIFDI